MMYNKMIQDFWFVGKKEEGGVHLETITINLNEEREKRKKQNNQ